MALLMYDGFELGAYSAPESTSASWWSSTGMSFSSVNVNTGLWSSYAGNSYNSSTPTLSVTGTNDFLILGFFFRRNTTSGVSQWIKFSCDNNTNNQIYVQITNTGTINIVSGSETGTVLATSSSPGSGGWSVGWGHLQIKIKIHPTSGFVIVQYNDAQIINYSGNTRYLTGASDNIDTIQWRVSSGGDGAFNIDDVWLINEVSSAGSQGWSNNDFMGQCKIYPLRPNGVGATQSWSVSGAPTHHEAVDESPPNTTDYISGGSGSSVKDLVATTSVGGTYPLVFGVTPIVTARKDDGGFAKIWTVVRDASGGESTDSIDFASPLSNSWLNLVGSTRFFQPSSGAKWSRSDVSNLQLGVTTTTPDTLNDIYLAYPTGTMADINAAYATLQNIDDHDF